MSDRDPRVREALDRFQPAPGDARADWGDVRRRAAAIAPRRRLRRLGAIALGAAGALAGIVLVALLIVQGPSGDRREAGIGDPAPAVTFQVVYPDPTYGLVAPETTLASLRGQVVVLSFIDPDCPDCGAAADVLGAVTMTPASALIVVSGRPADEARRLGTGPMIVTTPKGDTVRGFRGIATATDPDGAVERAFGVAAHPTIVVIDRQGRIARRYTRVPAARALQGYVARVARGPAPAVLPAATPVEPHLAVFDDPSTAWDGRPRSLWPDWIPCPYVPGSIRVAATGPRGEALLLAQGLDGSLVRVDHWGGRLAASTGCGAPRTQAARAKALRTARSQGHLGVSAGTAGGRYGLGLVILDGYDRITIDGVTHPVPHNGFIGTFAARPSRVIIGGPAGERRVYLP